MFHRAEGREEKSECEAGSVAKRWLVKNGKDSCRAPAEPGGWQEASPFFTSHLFATDPASHSDFSSLPSAR
jgi:hypothetical protein